MRAWEQENRGQVMYFEGSDALEDNFKMFADSADVIYIASHGFWAEQDLPIPAQLSARNGVALFTETNPLLKCGIALSGANLKGQGCDTLSIDDGILTGEEIATLNLRNQNLVVLSTCESGIGRIEDGEGVYALKRAFELAGAKSILSTLWRVDDHKTAEMLAKLSLETGPRLPFALRDAMLDQRDQLVRQGLPDHPYFWAGFVSSGQLGATRDNAKTIQKDLTKP
ncbi:MAG: CHAT domain-containing protein [bacterium]|nr:CHAT domain-containing protein [bacterium]